MHSDTLRFSRGSRKSCGFFNSSASFFCQRRKILDADLNWCTPNLTFVEKQAYISKLIGGKNQQGNNRKLCDKENLVYAMFYVEFIAFNLSYKTG